jgi:hypothetical protein
LRDRADEICAELLRRIPLPGFDFWSRVTRWHFKRIARNVAHPASGFLKKRLVGIYFCQ